MKSPLQTLLDSGTKLWLDTVDLDQVAEARQLGATGATSNPLIIGELIKSGRFDDQLATLIEAGHDDEAIAWAVTDRLVSDAEQVFAPVWDQTDGDDGYVSFELDPLLEDPGCRLDHHQRVARYIELGQHFASSHRNRLIKVPATAAGLEAARTLAAEGVALNVTLIFSPRQYRVARDQIFAGRHESHSDNDRYKSVYSIFVSRLDVYTADQVPSLSDPAQGTVGILNAKRIWQENQQFWRDKHFALKQEIVFASTGTKRPEDPPDKYVAALAGSDIQTNPPKTLEQVQRLGGRYVRKVDQLPAADVIAQIDRQVDMRRLEQVLLAEGVRKFADPHKALLALISQKRSTLAAT